MQPLALKWFLNIMSQAQNLIDPYLSPYISLTCLFMRMLSDEENMVTPLQSNNVLQIDGVWLTGCVLIEMFGSGCHAGPIPVITQLIDYNVLGLFTPLVFLFSFQVLPRVSNYIQLCHPKRVLGGRQGRQAETHPEIQGRHGVHRPFPVEGPQRIHIHTLTTQT